MKTKTVFSLYKKEIIDIFRDKKTVLMMIIVPILLYPLLMLAGFQIVNMISADMQSKTYQVAFHQVEGQEQIEKIMSDETDEYDYHFKVVESQDYKKDLQEKKIDAYLTTKEEAGQLNYEIQYISSVTNSAAAASMLEDIIYAYREQLRTDKIGELDLDVKAVLYPITTKLADQASKEESVGNLIGSIIPFLLITSILLGAMYPAIDVTAGEKERGTLETLLTLPVSNHELILSKFFAVATVACISALLNLLSMGLMGGFLYNSLSLAGTEAISLHIASFIPVLVILLFCILTFVLFITAIVLCVCIFAKSFKEAQNYSTPIMLVVMLASYVGFMPNVELTTQTAVIPVVNICLLIKQVFSFQYNLSIIFIVLLSNMAYSMLAVMIMGRIYNSEGILFGDGNGSLKLFERRANIKAGEPISLVDAILLLLVCMLGSIYLGSFAQARFGFYGIAANQVFFLLLPVAFAFYTKCAWKEVFSIKLPSVKAVAGSIILWVGTYMIGILISVPLARLFPDSMESVEGMANLFTNQSILGLLVVTAVLPAICEETLFRGFTFGALKEKFKPILSILLVAALFGLYHMSILKFFTTGILGLAFTYSVYCSGSIFTSMLMHFLNNGIAIWLTVEGEKHTAIVKLLNVEQFSVPQKLLYIGIAVLCIGVGGLLLYLNRRKGKCQHESIKT